MGYQASLLSPPLGAASHPTRSVLCSAHPVWLLRLCVWVKIHLVWRFRPKVAVTKSAQICLDSNNQDPRAQKDRGDATSVLPRTCVPWMRPGWLPLPAPLSQDPLNPYRTSLGRRLWRGGSASAASPESAPGGVKDPTPPAHLPRAARPHPSRPPSPAQLPEERARRPRDWNWIGLPGRGEPSLAPPGFVRSPLGAQAVPRAPFAPAPHRKVKPGSVLRAPEKVVGVWLIPSESSHPKAAIHLLFFEKFWHWMEIHILCSMTHGRQYMLHVRKILKDSRNQNKFNVLILI